jgi:hypothetical protein
VSANKVANIQPATLAAAAANILNAAITSLTGSTGITLSQPYLIVKHIRVVNNDTAAHTLNLYKGATGGSSATTALAVGQSIPANSAVDVYYGQLRLDSTDFISGFADVANKLVVFFDADIGFA